MDVRFALEVEYYTELSDRQPYNTTTSVGPTKDEVKMKVIDEPFKIPMMNEDEPSFVLTMQ